MPTLHAILAATDYADDPRPEVRPLAGAEADARAMAALLAGRTIAGGELGGLTLLLGPLATTQAIREAIARGVAATTGPGDTLLVFFAGHGTQEDDQGLVLLSADGEYPADQLVEDCGTDREPIAVVLDCCHGGAVAASKAAAIAEDERDRMLKLQLNQLQFICSAAADQRAFERQGRGVFTRQLVDALATRRDPPLLALPMNVVDWCYALPKDLLDAYDMVEGGRDLLRPTLPGAAAEPGPQDSDQKQTYVTENAPPAAPWVQAAMAPNAAPDPPTAGPAPTAPRSGAPHDGERDE